MPNKDRLSTGNPFFPPLRFNHQIYVDKTETIFKLARERGRFLLTRPRRFGKTLLISALASLFESGTRDFQGLAIEKLWIEKTYDVLHLDFSVVSDFDTAEQFLARLCGMLGVWLEDHGFAPSGTPASFFPELAQWLRARPAGSLVWLIDEYDAPLTVALEDEALFQGVQEVLRDFYAMLSACDSAFRFVFITGITRFDKAGIFSEFNQLTDISTAPECETLVGFTEEELKHYYADFLQDAARTHGTPVSALLRKLRDYYGGYAFGRAGAPRVYCPWSVLNFFSDSSREFENYWFGTCSSQEEVMNCLAARQLDEPWGFLAPVPSGPDPLLSSAPSGASDATALLLQTGYLTIRPESPEAGSSWLLDYPNRDVAASIANLYAKNMVGNNAFSPRELLDHMLNGKASEAISFINAALTSLNYHRYPVRDEASFQSFMQVLMIGASLLPQVEVHSARGRSDMEVDAGDYRWVFEFKFARKGDDAKALCQDAADQILKQKYGETPHGKHLARVAMVFEEEARQVTAWQAL